MFSAHRLSLAVVFVASAGVASAQAPSSVTTWDHGTTVNVFGGAARTGDARAAAAGAALGWELTPRVAVEGTGTWLDWGHGTSAFAAAMTARLAVVTPRPFAPFATAGIGVYHASFDRTGAAMPMFYQRRWMMRPSQVGSRAITFTDPSIVAGGGVTLHVSRNWTLRPEIMATMILQEARQFIVTTGAVRLGYHFEDHQISPRR